MHWLSPLQLVEQLPSCAALQDNEDMGLVIEVSIHFDDVGVVEVELYLEFPNKLLSDFFLSNELFLDHLQRTYEACIPLPN